MSATLSGQVEGFVLLLTSYKDLLSGRDDFIYRGTSGRDIPSGWKDS